MCPNPYPGESSQERELDLEPSESNLIYGFLNGDLLQGLILCLLELLSLLRKCLVTVHCDICRELQLQYEVFLHYDHVHTCDVDLYCTYTYILSSLSPSTITPQLPN